MRSGFRIKENLLLALVISLAMIVASCGKKKNTVNSDDNNNSGTTFFGPGSPTFTASQQADVQNIISNVPCNNYPNRRLSQTYTFSSSNINYGNSKTSIYGPFNQNTVSGNISKIFVGISIFGDVMIVSKVGNGSQVSGYNVQLSMCAEWNRQTNVPYIDDQRPVVNFQANQIVLDEDNNCGYGSVDSAQNTIVTTGQFNGNNGGFSFSLPAYNAYTTFYKPSCNGQN